MSFGRFVHLDDATVLALTERAVLLELSTGEEVWIPLSHVAADDRDGLQVGYGHSLAITEWIAKQKGIEA